MASNIAMDGFQSSTVAFSTVSGHELNVDILVPEGLPAGKHPVIVTWHGGALITGARNFKDLFPPWLAPFAAKHNAIVLSPDYRKLPEARGSDLLADVEAFWAWLHASFSQTLHELFAGKHQADLDHVLLEGHSAGGWVAAHQALAHADDVRATLLIYPMLAIDREPRPPYTGSRPEFLGSELLSREQLDEQAAPLKYPSVFLEGGWERAIMAFSAMKHGVIGDWVGTDPKLDVFRRVTAGERLPNRMWITHGTADSTVDVKGTETFEASIRKHSPSTDLRVDYLPGEDHAFDLSMDPSKLNAGLDWISSAWLGN